MGLKKMHEAEKSKREQENNSKDLIKQQMEKIEELEEQVRKDFSKMQEMESLLREQQNVIEKQTASKLASNANSNNPTSEDTKNVATNLVAELKEANKHMAAEWKKQFPKLSGETIDRFADKAMQEGGVLCITHDKEYNEYKCGLVALDEYRAMRRTAEITDAVVKLYEYVFVSKRRKPNRAVLDAPANLKAEMEILESLSREKSSAIKYRANCRFYQFKKRKEAEEWLSGVYRRIDSSIKTIIDLGVHAPHTSYEREKEVLANCEQVMRELQRAAGEERIATRLDLAVQDDVVARKEAKNRVVELCRVCPANLKVAVRTAVIENIRHFNGKGQTHYETCRELERVIDEALK